MKGCLYHRKTPLLIYTGNLCPRTLVAPLSAAWAESKTLLQSSRYTQLLWIASHCASVECLTTHVSGHLHRVRGHSAFPCTSPFRQIIRLLTVQTFRNAWTHNTQDNHIKIVIRESDLTENIKYQYNEYRSHHCIATIQWRHYSQKSKWQYRNKEREVRWQ